jgi:CRP/FNR family cyclic AMP-dependent transcriptional regulator
VAARRIESLLELDPELGRLLSEGRREQARAHLQVEVETVQPGEWEVSAARGEGRSDQIGLLLLDGVVTCELTVEDTVSAELLGPGDLLRPEEAHEHDRLLARTVRWTVILPARVARLDARFGTRLAAWPEVNAVLIDRVNARAQRLATTQAISQLNGVDRRLQALLWHLAERWGRMTREGVVVPLPLSHRMLSQLVGARRPSVSTALGALARRGEVVRLEDETWLLTGEPTGAPAPDMERVVPIRRRLFAREAPAEEPELEPADPRLAAIRARAAYTDLHATVQRLQIDTQANFSALTATTAEADRLITSLRARRQIDARGR